MGNRTVYGAILGPVISLALVAPAWAAGPTGSGLGAVAAEAARIDLRLKRPARGHG